MAQGKFKVKTSKPKSTHTKPTQVKKGSIVRKSNLTGVHLENKKIQKQLWAKSTEATEKLMASKAKSCGKLRILGALGEAKPDPKNKRGKKSNVRF